jgi:hypothetical protein
MQSRHRITQLICLVIVAACIAVSSAVLPRMNSITEERALRYTDVQVESAPPIVVLGQVIGALRGLIVDYLWIKVNAQKEEGLFYEIMHDSELITKLQPRFAEVWAFHGHNMAYNVSVATHTVQERWEWVNAGIRLVRDQGIRYNPNNLDLHRELAWWFAHKIDGYSDDANLYYKRRFAEEWHTLLGEPPDGYEDRTAWIKAIADAPDTFAEAASTAPSLRDLVQQLRDSYPPNAKNEFKLDSNFLRQYAKWQAIAQNAEIAEAIGMRQRMEQDPAFVAFNTLASDPARASAWEALLNHTRKRVLLDEYNMNPQLMYEYTRDLGPLDWRHPQAHALYWSRKGSQFGEARVPEHDVYRKINNDRIQIQAMQGLARSGRIYFDPFSTEPPGRFPDPRWIDSIESQFEYLYVKYIDTRGAGSDTFIAFLENFLKYAIREAYRNGERARAQRMLDRLDELFGTGGIVPNPYYSIPLDVFVRQETQGVYDEQPYLAPSEVAASLRYGFIVGIGQNREDVLKQALQFADDTITFFRNNEYYGFDNKFGVGRIRDILGELEVTAPIVYAQLITDRTVPPEMRMQIWRQTDRFSEFDLIRTLRLDTYDAILPQIQREWQTSAWGAKFSVDEFLPEPPGMDAYRLRKAEEEKRKRDAENDTTDIDRES